MCSSACDSHPAQPQPTGGPQAEKQGEGGASTPVSLLRILITIIILIVVHNGCSSAPRVQTPPRVLSTTLALSLARSGRSPRVALPYDIKNRPQRCSAVAAAKGGMAWPDPTIQPSRPVGSWGLLGVARRQFFRGPLMVDGKGDCNPSGAWLCRPGTRIGFVARSRTGAVGASVCLCAVL